MIIGTLTEFTFHYVSIKTLHPVHHLYKRIYLHSTMYLLKHS